ncbi:MAG TPA: aminopeptidase [Methanomicrobia archaeon]|nr:aminopeptidase [Methanomicrobia archaeon]
MKDNAWLKLNKEEVFKFCDEYCDFLSRCKTEREVVDYIVSMAEKNGFSSMEKGGKKIYEVNRGKSVILAVRGKKDLEEGLRIIASHADSPRLDLKPNPVYEEEEIALLKTHYYGGIKKYQWVSIPLAMHGVIVKENGEKLNIILGENPEDPVFTVCDLLPHLAKKIQGEKKFFEGIAGEELNILFGSMRKEDKEKEKIKRFIVELLEKKYDIKEEDLISAEIQFVPNFKARDVGIDKSFIGAYGHDDKVCVFTSLKAILEMEDPEYTCVFIAADREEIGSEGPTGMKSRAFENFLIKIADSPKLKDLVSVFENSKVLSADVSAGLNPTFKDAQEKHNAAKLGYGVVIERYTGSRGKYSTNETTAEFTAEIRKIFNKNNIHWQAAELGKVDEGGGGTIAKFLANYNMDVIDCGTPLLGMHSPFEIASKADIYETYRAYKAFYEG